MAWVTVKNNTNWEYDNDPPDPGGALTTLWETSTGGIRTSKRGDEIYTNCRLKVNHATRASVPNEINKTFWSGPWDILDLDPYLLFDTQSSMIGTLENPTLDLDPANPETLDVITATRAGVATYTDADGLIQSASPNTTRVDYTQGAELTPTKFQRVGYTDFSSGWGAFGGFTSQSADDFEGESAIRLVSDGTSSNYYQVEIQNTEDQQQYTFSFYCRRVSGSGDTAARHALSATGNSTSINVSSIWQRFEVTCLGKTGGGSVYIGLIQSSGDGVYEFSQPQLEEGTTASDFVANTTGSPKFITGATYGARVPMILVEPSATNLAKRTDFSSGWTTLSSSATAGGGYAGQSSVVVTATGSSGRYRQGLSGESSGVTYTASIWIRRISGNGSIRFEHNSSPTGNTSSSLNITEEWSRVEAEFEGSCFAWGIQIDTSGDSVEIAMPQVEDGTVATSFIPTSGSAVTRAADDLSIDPDSTNLVTHSDFSGGWQEYLINSSAGSGYSLNSSRVITSTGTNAAYYIPVPTSNGATYTASIWARRVSGSGGCNIIYLSSPTAKQSISLTTEWQKFTATFTGKSGGGDVNFGVDIVTSGDSIEIAMPQVELGSSPTGFILTSGAAASRTTFSDFYNASEGTFYIEDIPRVTNSTQIARFSLNDGTNATSMYSLVSGAYDLLVKANGSAVSYNVGGATIVPNQLERVAFSYITNEIKVSRDGALNNPANNPSTQAIPVVDRLHLGQIDGFTRNLNGRIRRLIFWPYSSDRL